MTNTVPTTIQTVSSERRSLRLRLGEVQRSTVGSMVAGCSSQVALVVSGVLAARVLGPENRGHLALLVLAPSVLSQLGTLGLPLAATYFIARDPRNAGSIAASLVRPGLAQVVGLMLLHAGVLWWIGAGESRQVKVAALLTMPLVAVSLVQSYGLAVLQGQRRFLWFNLLRQGPVTCYSLAVLAIYLVGPRSLVGVTLAWVVACSLAGLATAIVSLASLPAPVSEGTPSLGELSRFGLKGFLGSVSPVEAFRPDQAVIALFLTPAALGAYVAALAFTNLPRFVSQSVGMVAYPHVAGAVDPATAWRSIARFTAFATGLSVIVAGAVALIADRLVPLFFGSEFEDAAPAVRILLIGSVLFAARRVLGEGVRGVGRPGLNTLAELLSWLWLLPTLLLLAPRYGIEGAAWAVTGASAVGLVILLAASVVAARKRSATADGPAVTEPLPIRELSLRERTG